MARKSDGLKALSDFVAGRGFAGCGHDWREAVRQFADQRAFLDLSAVRREVGDDLQLLIEFGVRDGSERNRVGFMDAHYNETTGTVNRVAMLSLEGMAVGLDDFMTRIGSYLDLPVVSTELVSNE